jgi:hypothetical protein
VGILDCAIKRLFDGTSYGIVVALRKREPRKSFVMRYVDNRRQRLEGLVAFDMRSIPIVITVEETPIKHPRCLLVERVERDHIKSFLSTTNEVLARISEKLSNQDSFLLNIPANGREAPLDDSCKRAFHFQCASIETPLRPRIRTRTLFSTCRDLLRSIHHTHNINILGRKWQMVITHPGVSGKNNNNCEY